MKNIVIFDLDGTLALIEHRRHLVENKPADWNAFYKACVDDKPNYPVMSVLGALRENGFKIGIFSGRSDLVYNETQKWLAYYAINFDFIKMRKEGDFTPDEVLKKRWLEEIGKENVYCVFDDRDKVVKMWRDEGLTCFQVAPGAF